MDTILNPYLSVHYLYILTVAIVVIAFFLSIAVFSTRRKFTKKNITRSRFFFASHVLFLLTITLILFWLSLAFLSATIVVNSTEDMPAAFLAVPFLMAGAFGLLLPVQQLLLKLLAIIISLALYGPFIQKFYTKSSSYVETMPPTRGEYIKLAISLLFLVLPFLILSFVYIIVAQKNSSLPVTSQNNNSDNFFDATSGAQKQNTPTSTAPTPSAASANPEQSTKISSVWVPYQNNDIGVAFSYPEAWGEIKSLTESGCMPDYGYYGASAIQQMIKEMSATNDPCTQVRLAIIGSNEVFLSTWSKLYTKYPVPRGGYWGVIAGRIQTSASVETYCANRPKENCSTYKNSNGILVARSFEVAGYGDRRDWIYVIKSAHPLYNGIVLYAGHDAEYKKIIEQVVDTLRFLPYTSPTSEENSY